MRSGWTIVLRTSVNRLGEDQSRPIMFEIRNSNEMNRVVSRLGFLSMSSLIALRVIDLIESRTLGWMTVGTFLDGQQVIRLINRVAHFVDCRMHRLDAGDDLLLDRCLDENCGFSKPFIGNKKLVVAFQKREISKGESL